jgi:hypothetical protein
MQFWFQSGFVLEQTSSICCINITCFFDYVSWPPYTHEFVANRSVEIIELRHCEIDKLRFCKCIEIDNNYPTEDLCRNLHSIVYNAMDNQWQCKQWNRLHPYIGLKLQAILFTETYNIQKLTFLAMQSEKSTFVWFCIKY